VQVRETQIGFEIDTPEYLFFFGKKGSTTEALQKEYPQFTFVRLNQVHGNAIQERRDNLDRVPADGQWTKKQKLAMTINTGDCVPVMIVHPASQTILGIHAGWRGVENRIVPKGLMLMQEQGAKPDEMFAIIGPHIQQSSFEVEATVKDQLLASAGFTLTDKDESIAIPSKNAGKFMVDLNAIVKMQLAEFSLSPDQVFDLHLDTFSDSRFHSYRRDKADSGRQLSFVVRK
jgi:hypothetical protein